MSGRQQFGVWSVLLLAALLVGCGAAARPAPTPPPPIVAPVGTSTATDAAATILTATVARTPTTPRAPNATATIAVAVQTDVPAKAMETLRYVRAHDGKPPPGYVGGTTFQNRERLLPPGQYKEYDIDPQGRGGRNAERLVIEQRSGQAYYTGDHYATFIPINEGR